MHRHHKGHGFEFPLNDFGELSDHGVCMVYYVGERKREMELNVFTRRQNSLGEWEFLRNRAE